MPIVNLNTVAFTEYTQCKRKTLVTIMTHLPFIGKATTLSYRFPVIWLMVSIFDSLDFICSKTRRPTVRGI